MLSFSIYFFTFLGSEFLYSVANVVIDFGNAMMSKEEKHSLLLDLHSNMKTLEQK